jgi:P-type Ca2+ transporter type 2C
VVLLALVGLVDPPRPEARAAIAECRAAGIRVRMITGEPPRPSQGSWASLGRP